MLEQAPKLKAQSSIRLPPPQKPSSSSAVPRPLALPTDWLQIGGFPRVSWVNNSVEALTELWKKCYVYVHSFIIKDATQE